VEIYHKDRDFMVYTDHQIFCSLVTGIFQYAVGWVYNEV
jgi:hypothetical protein